MDRSRSISAISPVPVSRTGVPTTRQPVPSSAGRKRPPLVLLALLGFLLLAVGYQWLGGAYHSELDGYPDEASHYITGLMIHDYALSGLGESPLAFGKRFYSRFPRVALGHWPPAFYVVEAVWTLIFRESKVSVLLLIAMFTAGSAYLIHRIISPRFGIAAGLLSGALWILLPRVQEQSGMVMLEMPFIFVTLLTILELIRFLERPDEREGVKLGLLIFLAIMTKGNGWFLVLPVALAVALTGRWELLRRRPFWTVVLITAAAIPIQMISAHNVAEALPGHFGLGVTVDNVFAFTRSFAVIAGVPLCLLALSGALIELGVPLARGRVLPIFPAVMAGLLAGVVLFHSIVPAGLELRKMLPGLPALFYLAWCGLEAIFRFAAPRHARWVAAAMALIVVFASPAGIIFNKPRYSVDTAVAAAAREPESRVWLVSGSATFEGAVLAEIALAGGRQQRVVLRGTKVLCNTDFNSTFAEEIYPSTQALREFLSRTPVNLIAIERLPPDPLLPHNQRLWSLLDQSKEWHRLGGVPSNQAALYIRTSPNPAANEDWLRRAMEFQVPRGL